MTGDTYEHDPDDDQDRSPLDEAGKARQAHDLTNAIVDKQFGDMVEYQRERVIAEARFYLGQSAAAMLEAGKRLILLKEHEPHGEFTDAVEALGLTVRTAQRLMRASLKFGSAKATTLSHLNKSKLLLLAMEDQEEIDELGEGGTIAHLTLDDIDKMSVRELRKALRKSRTDHADDTEAKERLIADKNDKLDEYDTKVHTLLNRSHPWPERVMQIGNQVNEQGGLILQALARLDQLRDAIQNEPFETGGEEEAFDMLGRVYYDTVARVLEQTAQTADLCDQIFQGIKDQAIPLESLWLQLRERHPDLFGDEETGQ